VSDTSHWIDGGVTPVDSLRVPRGVAIHLRLEKDGFRPFDGIRFGSRGTYVLDSGNAPLAEMVRVNGGLTSPLLVGLDGLPPVTIAAFRMDRKEITNRGYKAFVDAGGYTNAKYWTQPFIHDGKALSFSDAVALLKDKTGRPGPATWEGGDYLRGQADAPVGGVSWFEAAAYAAFAGKSLPTAFHWSSAAGTSASAWIIPGSNFNTGAPRAASPSGVSVFGVYDMAGNAREWVFNADGRGRNYILGGGFTDETYAFNEGYAQDPFDRSPSNGIRLVTYAANDSSIALAQRPLVRAWRDYAKEKPVPNAVFEAYRNMYDYEHAPLDVKVVQRDTANPDWIAERITYDAGYNRERTPANLFIPKRHAGKAQAVVFFPGDNGFGQKNLTSNYANVIDYIVRSGRVVIVPVYKSTYERTDSLKSTLPDTSLAYRDHMLIWGKDVHRAVDVLQSLPEVDSSRIAYMGVSWGGRLGGTMVAIEPRIKAAVLIVAGYRMQAARPEADPVNFVPHITQPVLLIGARYDDYFPVETSQRPFFNQLGTPADRKKWIVIEGGHSTPRTQVIGPTLDWLDRYLGAASK
jgi:dienelactone hydrolase